MITALFSHVRIDNTNASAHVKMEESSALQPVSIVISSDEGEDNDESDARNNDCVIEISDSPVKLIVSPPYRLDGDLCWLRV